MARAIFDSKIPIISAVGHEVDYSISDFVADGRSATPTQAAVLAVPDINEIRFLVEDYTRKLELLSSGAIEMYKERVQNLAKSYALQVVQQKLTNARNRVQSLQDKVQFRTQHVIRNQKERLTEFSHHLDRMNPNEPLEKGFARVWQADKWIRSANSLEEDTEFSIEWKDGRKHVNEA